MISKTLKTAVIAGLTASTAMISAASATEGYFQTAFGARHSGMAGAGLAYITDSTGLGLNPAGIAGLDRQFNLGLTLFNPRRKTIGYGQPGLTPVGEVKSDKNWFPVPNISYVAPAGDYGTWGAGVFANGGMNTTYAAVDRDVQECGGGNGIFCGGKAGVDLMQAFITGGYGHQVNENLKLGVSAMIAVQRFKADGLGAFAAQGFSSDPANFTNRDGDMSTGFGVKIGATYDWEKFSVAATYQPKINMSKFDKYAGLFAQGGDFDIPATYSVGGAFHLNEAFAIVADYRHVAYDKVASIGNTPNVPAQFGSENGPGFGWDAVNSYKIGMEVKMSETFTYRIGFGFNNNPVSEDEVTLNVLAPGVVTRHISGGFTYEMGGGNSFNFAATYVPYKGIAGPGMLNPNHIVEIGMSQYMATFGWKKTF